MYDIGYTTGVFDLFHIGHLNLLKAAAGLCDKLIVGVTTDEVAYLHKGRFPVIPYEQRIEIIKSLDCVASAIPQNCTDKMDALSKLHFDVVFVGDDWKGNETWECYELNGLNVMYLPYTEDISTTRIIDYIKASK